MIPIKLKTSDYKKISTYLMASAVVTIILSFVGYLGIDIWLASTQWLLVTIVLALFGIYFKLGKS